MRWLARRCHSTKTSCTPTPPPTLSCTLQPGSDNKQGIPPARLECAVGPAAILDSAAALTCPNSADIPSSCAVRSAGRTASGAEPPQLLCVLFAWLFFFSSFLFFPKKKTKLEPAQERVPLTSPREELKRCDGRPPNPDQKGLANPELGI